jgi:hypothetical protein
LKDPDFTSSPILLFSEGNTMWREKGAEIDSNRNEAYIVKVSSELPEFYLIPSPSPREKGAFIKIKFGH